MGSGRISYYLMPRLLVIGGSDSSGGAGITADIETISGLGGKCLPILTAVTAQGANGFFHSHAMPAAILEAQLESVADQKIDAIKIGMLPNKVSIKILSDFLEKSTCKSIILDPVMMSSSGSTLMNEDAVNILKDLLFPLVSLITPNLFEANFLTEGNCTDKNEIPIITSKLISLGSNAVLLKGGHLEGAQCTDFFLQSNGNKNTFEHERIKGGTEVRGTGCRLASAISYYLACGRSLPKAISQGVDYLQSYISRNID